MRIRSRLLFVLWLTSVTLVSCSKTPPTPQTGGSGTEERITGRERVGWDQQAADAVELATFRYAMYVDGVRAELSNVSCATSSGSGGFACTASLPALSPGAHTLELAAFVVDGTTVAESPRSAPLRVNVAAVTPSAVPQVEEARSSTSTADRTRQTSLTAHFAVARVATGLQDPTDATFAPDGPLFVTEIGGHVRSVKNGALHDMVVPDEVLVGYGNGLFAIAIDPEFERTRFVYLVYTSVSRFGEPIFRLARFREVNDTLAERAVLLDGVRASDTNAAASLRFGPDGKLYVAFDSAGQPDSVGDAASYNGKILRLNADGTTPADQPAHSPVYAYGFAVPVGLDWQRATNALWFAGRNGGNVNRLRRVEESDVRSSIRREGVELSAVANMSAMAFYRGDIFEELRGHLLVVGGVDRRLMRVTIEGSNRAWPTAVDPLVDTTGIRTVAVRNDGAIYLCTRDEVVRLVRRGTR